jgi:LysM repeat protein
MKRWIGLIVFLVLAMVGALVGYVVTAPAPALQYTVVRGDTLGEIATAHGVTVDDLRRWNAIEGDLIEVGDVLLILAESPSSLPVPAAAPVRPRRASLPTPKATGLTRPRPKDCLDGPSGDGLGDVGAVASEGLSYTQIKRSMDAIAPHTLSCVPEGTTGRLETRIVVGCDGLVRSVETGATGGLPPDVVACVVDKLGYAEFPAHALPNGEIFDYPLTYSWD